MKFMLNAFAFCNCHLALLHKQNEINFALPAHTHTPTHAQTHKCTYTHSTHTTRCTYCLWLWHCHFCLLARARASPISHLPFPSLQFAFSILIFISTLVTHELGLSRLQSGLAGWMAGYLWQKHLLATCNLAKIVCIERQNINSCRRSSSSSSRRSRQQQQQQKCHKIMKKVL